MKVTTKIHVLSESVIIVLIIVEELIAEQCHQPRGVYHQYCWGYLQYNS
ncbi:MAG: hypothetical protein GY907_08580 [Bacteroidetes bacterium]|nr:hypothetical protein [Bacteroidota bacterium]